VVFGVAGKYVAEAEVAYGRRSLLVVRYVIDAHLGRDCLQCE
jgi:hypothetical protein